jgi:hypothetical protein
MLRYCVSACFLLGLWARLFALTPPADLDRRFNARDIVDGVVTVIVVQSDGRVLAGGNLTMSQSTNGQTQLGLVRLLEDDQDYFPISDVATLSSNRLSA